MTRESAPPDAPEVPEETAVPEIPDSQGISPTSPSLPEEPAAAVPEDIPASVAAEPGPAPQPAAEAEKPPETPPVKPAETQESVPQPTAAASVTIQIDCSAALPYQEDLGISLPEDGMLLDTTSVDIIPGTTTVYDVLRSTDALVVGSSGYIQGIDNLFEKDCTAGSGWIYTVNGTLPMMGCGAYRLQSGEVIVWRYVT